MAKKNVYDQVRKLAAYGVVEFVEEGNAKRPVVAYDEIVFDFTVSLGSEEDHTDEPVAAKSHVRFLQSVVFVSTWLIRPSSASPSRYHARRSSFLSMLMMVDRPMFGVSAATDRYDSPASTRSIALRISK